MGYLTAIKAVWAFVRRYWKEAAMLLLLLLAYLKGGHDTDAKWQARWLARDRSDAVAAQKATDAARKQEADWVAAFDVAATISNEEIKNVQAHRDRLLADIRAGRLSFKPAGCPVPQAPADPGQPQAAPERGQPGLAGEELVHRFAVCDEVVIERNQCVGLLSAERK